MAVLIVVLICLIAFVAGSAYGIFFAAEAPGEDAFTVQQAVEQLGGEYRDYLQQIESTMPHDRQEIKANDDVYYIRWQDVLAVFSSYVSGCGGRRAGGLSGRVAPAATSPNHVGYE